MTLDAQLRQQLLDLAYNRLPEPAAAELRRRLESDAELARAYAELQATARSPSDAGRLSLLKRRPRPWQKIARAAQQHPQPSAATGARPKRSPLARGANGSVALTAALLLASSLGAYWYHRGQLADIAAEHLRLVVVGPSRIAAQASVQYSVVTSSVTGAPVPAQVEASLYALDGRRLWALKEKAGDQGRLDVTIPAGVKTPDQARLEVLAVYRDKLERADVQVTVQPVGYLTRLFTDKPLYQPGDTLYYRSLTLSRFGLAADREVPIRFAVLDPDGTVVAGSATEGLTDRGVGNGAFSLGEDISGGRYTLVAQSLDGSFPEERQSFVVRRQRLPRLTTQLQFVAPHDIVSPSSGSKKPDEPGKAPARGKAAPSAATSGASYSPGDTVTANVVVRRTTGGPAAGAELRALATVDGKRIFEKSLQTDQSGTAAIEFALPGKIDRGEGQLLVVVDDGGAQETAAKAIPINLGQVEVSFFPEGGNLVADLENRVYFAARDARGAPVDIKGFVVDSSGTDVAMCETTRDGMGSLSYAPLAGEAYALRITQPPGVKDKPKLPKASADYQVVLTTGTGVFAAGAPLEFNLRATKADLPLVVAVSCRGMPVAQHMLITASKTDGANPVAIPLSDQVGGVLCLTVYDYSASLPKPVAERLVYRRMARRLKVRASADQRSYAPGEKVEVQLKVTNEKDQPVPAVLGVAVVDDALFGPPSACPPALDTRFLLASEIQRPDDLAAADFYLSNSADARLALDHLLAIQGWRRFVDKTAGELKPEGRHDEPIARLLATDGEPRPPAVFDNLHELRENYKESLASYRADRTRVLNTLTTLSFFGGLGLMLLVAMLGLLKIVSGVHLWLSAVGSTACCLIIGAILMDPDRLRSTPDVAVAFAPFHAASHEPVAGGARQKSSTTADSAASSEHTAENKNTRPAAENAAGRIATADRCVTAASVSALPAATPRGVVAAETATPGETETVQGAEQTADKNRAATKSPRPSTEKPRPQRQGEPGVVEETSGGKAAGKSPEVPAQQRFTVRQYAHRHATESPEVRSDFAQTLFWHPLLLADAAGRASIHFNLPDSPTAFRVLADAHGEGRIGSGGCKIVSRLPLRVEAKVPPEVSAGDRLELPVSAANDGQRQLPLELRLRHGELVKLDGAAKRKLVLSPGQRGREYFTLHVVGETGPCELTVRGTAGSQTDGVRELLHVTAPGFPAHLAYRGQIAGHSEVAVALPEFWLPGSLHVLLQLVSPGSPQALRGGQPVVAGKPERSHWPPESGAMLRKRVAQGKLIFQRDGQTIGEYPFGPAHDKEAITIEHVEVNLRPEENRLTVLLTADDPMAYGLDVDCRTRKPQSDVNCPLRLSAQLAGEQVKLGEMVTLTAELTNVSGEEQPRPVTIVGLPGGLEPRIEQLDELQGAGIITHYELRPREVLCVWRSLAAQQKGTIALDLIATVPGKFIGPASRSYPQRADQRQQWTDPLQVEITRD